MDRDRLRAWLTSPHRTLRWRSDEDPDRYEGVTTSDEGLRWFRWSHHHGEGGEGEHEARLQSFDDFRAEGPLRPMPEAREIELRAWVAAHARSSSSA